MGTMSLIFFCDFFILRFFNSCYYYNNYYSLLLTYQVTLHTYILSTPEKPIWCLPHISGGNNADDFFQYS